MAPDAQPAPRALQGTCQAVQSVSGETDLMRSRIHPNRRWCTAPGVQPPSRAPQGTFRAAEFSPGETDQMKSRVHPNYKTKYRVQNWPEYERGLVQRGVPPQNDSGGIQAASRW